MRRHRNALIETKIGSRWLLAVQIGSAGIHDRDGAGSLLQASRQSLPFIERAVADAAYTAERVRAATRIAIEIVRKIPGQSGSEVYPRTWVVERCFA